MRIRRIAALAALGLLVAACSPGSGTGGELQGTDWVLQSYAKDGSLTIVPETHYADARFNANRLQGFSGCNQYDGAYRAGGRLLLVSNLAVTSIACDQAAMDFEQAYLALLRASRFYGTRGATLTVYDADRNVSLVFDAAPRNPLLGSWRIDSYGTSPGTVVAPLEGSRLEAVFGIASVGGFAGCNSYSGTYGTNGNIVRVGRLATTGVACAQDLMDQETAVLAALEGAALIDSRGTSVNLTDRSGRLLIALSRPPTDGGAEASPTPTATPQATASPTAAPTATPTPEPTPTPTPAPTPTPTPAPTPAPTPTASAVVPPSPPPAASCKLIPPAGVTVATIVYPGAWYTVTEPAELACRYFDPQPITVPADPATLQTAITAEVTPTTYPAAVAAATNPANWTVTWKSEVNVRGTPVTCVGAVATSDLSGLAAGTASTACLADVGTAGTVEIRTTGIPGDREYAIGTAVVTLMTIASTFTPPG